MFESTLRKFIFWTVFMGLAILPACRFEPDTTEPMVERTEGTSPTRSAGETSVGKGGLDFLSQVDSLLPAFETDLESMPDLPHYRIRVEIDPNGLAYRGHLELDFTNLETVALDQLYLRLYPNGGESYGNGEIKVSTILLNGGEVEARLSLSNSLVEVPLTESLLPGEKTNLNLDFSGQVPIDFGGEESPNAYGIFNYSEGVLALSDWYPILAVFDQDGWNLDPVRPVGDAVYSDMAYYSVEVTLPTSSVLAATGVELDRQVNDQKSVVQLASGPARTFFLVTSPDFVLSSANAAGVSVNVYTLGDLSEARQHMLEVAVDSMKIFNQDFGMYPYRELDIVQAPMRNAGGVEFPGIVLIEAGRSQEPQNPILATTVSHEVAHQWWYNLVGNDVIEEPWVDEALTTFSSMLYWEKVYGAAAYGNVRADFQSRYDKAVENEVQGEINDGIEFYSQADHTSGYGAIVYMKGALFFTALREEIGDKAFFGALQDYYREHRYGIASGKDLLAAFEAISGRSLADFYRVWLRIGD